jgi:hypothetical protein
MDTKVTMIEGVWVRVPAQLTRLADKWKETLHLPSGSLSENVRYLSLDCFTPEDRPAVLIYAPWFA